MNARRCYGVVAWLRDFILGPLSAGRDDPVVDRSNDPADKAAFDVDEIQVQIGALTDAATQRQRLIRGTPEYESALETEKRLASYVWSLATPIEPAGETAIEAQERLDQES